MGLKPWELYDFTMNEFNNAYEGHHNKMEQFWGMARQVGYYVVAMQQDPKKAKIKKPQDLFKLSFEKNQPVKYTTFKKIDG